MWRCGGAGLVLQHTARPHLPVRPAACGEFGTYCLCRRLADCADFAFSHTAPMRGARGPRAAPCAPVRRSPVSFEIRVTSSDAA